MDGGAGFGPFDDLPEDRGPWLAARRVEMDGNECAWLVELGRFDREGGWALDGQHSVVGWLRWKTDLARPTAYEKVRVARALLVRPVLCQAFEAGRISYSAARVISRLDDPVPDAETDAKLVALAEAGSVDDVELAARVYRELQGQDLPPDERWLRRRAHVGTPTAGLTACSAVLAETEGDELQAALVAFRDKLWREDHPEASPGADGSGAGPDPAEPGASPGADGSGTEPAPVEAEVSPGADDLRGHGVPWADALMAMVRTALAHLHDDQPAGALPERFLVHYVHREDGALTRLDGSPVRPDLAGAVRCEAAGVDHLVGPGGEPLRLGRLTRDWNRAQRRAIAVRDGGQCRFPGCEHRRVDIHHCWHWEHGGPTDVDNGALLCPRHHALHHAGFVIEGGPDGELVFARPDGTPIGVTSPRTAAPRLPW